MAVINEPGKFLGNNLGKNTHDGFEDRGYSSRNDTNLDGEDHITRGSHFFEEGIMIQEDQKMSISPVNKLHN
jgi:hypothetical protein